MRFHHAVAIHPYRYWCYGLKKVYTLLLLLLLKLQFTRNGWSYVPIEEDGVAHEITVACIYGQGSQQTCRSSTSVLQETRSQVVGLAIFLPNPSRGDGDAAAERRAKVTLDRDRPEDVAPTTQTQQ